MATIDDDTRIKLEAILANAGKEKKFLRFDLEFSRSFYKINKVATYNKNSNLCPFHFIYFRDVSNLN